MWSTVTLRWSTGEKRKSMKIPITTSVDECISADAGVGASIASGNQTNSKNCAHFVAAAPNIANSITVGMVTSNKKLLNILGSNCTVGKIANNVGSESV